MVVRQGIAVDLCACESDYGKLIGYTEALAWWQARGPDRGRKQRRNLKQLHRDKVRTIRPTDQRSVLKFLPDRLEGLSKAFDKCLHRITQPSLTRNDGGNRQLRPFL